MAYLLKIFKDKQNKYKIVLNHTDREANMRSEKNGVQSYIVNIN